MKKTVKKVTANSKGLGSASEQKRDAPPPVLERPVKVNNVKQAKKLLSKLIYGLQTGEIEGRKAKDLTYLLSVFITIVKETEFDERLKELEKKLL